MVNIKYLLIILFLYINLLLLDIIKIHLGDQSDAKVLLGTYVCTETPGEFKWQPGALTQAVQGGKWIVIEDIDLASVDVISVILPLLETRKLFIPGRGEEIQAAHGFQIFATETLIGSDGCQTARGRASGKLLSKFWTKIVVNPLPDSELDNVLKNMYPDLSLIIDKFITTFHLLKSNTSHQIYGSARPLSVRDLMKWCRRVSRFCENEELKITNAESAQLKEIIFSEAYDCFCAMLGNIKNRREMMKQIAFAWNILPDHVDYFIEKYKPVIQITKTTYSIGRQILKRVKENDSKKANFALTMHALRNLERISVCVKLSEPVLLVGETGTGKTSVIQHLANQIGKKLVVQNLSQQSDSTDLLGGFKPIEVRSLCVPLKNEFDNLFPKTFSRKSNESFIEKVNVSYASQDWDTFIKLLHDIIKHVDDMNEESENPNSKRKITKLKSNILKRWKIFGLSVKKFIEQRRKISSNFAFAFVEGALVKAVRNGDWVLLDEINLASTETLESLSGLLEGGGLYLTEKGDISAVERHPEFRIFACMNPPTDIGKKELPPGLRNRFTEFYIEELDNEFDLKTVVMSYLSPIITNPPVESIVKFYLSAKKEALQNLSDGANQKPHYSLRSLCRALQYTKDVVQQFGFYRALYEGICMSFLTQLNQKSIPIMERLIHKFIVSELTKHKQNLKTVPKQPNSNYVKFAQFWIESGSFDVNVPSEYILTKTIKSHLTSLARIVLTRKYPVLLQGPTSSGKTSMVQYLAKSTGHKFVRINNHEHTDIQEYLGCYVSDEKGNLIFQEGILVEAVRNGYWVVLDELNLAPSEVLEALNRLLDDNRELFIPETQETIKPHPHFMIFATQNPAGAYGGRKVLSRAFRNRFLELHFDDIPDNELQIILEKRCSIAPSYCAKLVSVMKDLQRQRHGTKVFAGKNSLITLRDLFRWANRQANGYQELAIDGYMLLAERLRNEDEKEFIKSILEKHMKVKLNLSDIYNNQDETSQLNIVQNILKENLDLKDEYNIVWTYSMKRMFLLLSKCIANKEPVLLIGETGCGKTTVCQLFSLLLNRTIQILNCHQHTETADFLGSLRPIRGKEAITETLQLKLKQFFELLKSENIIESSLLIGIDNWNINQLISNFEIFMNSSPNLPGSIKSILPEISLLSKQYKSLFEWQDGPLIIGMKRGDLFLIDEISLAEDSVLERLNSVLEPDRSLVLAEKGGTEIEELKAVENFRIFATMNPGGDFGKRELSPALRNRFTEIWVPSITERDELIQILKERLNPSLSEFSILIIDFVEWFKETVKGKRLISLRDLLAWVKFMNILNNIEETYSFENYMHGACLVLLDGLPVSTGFSERRCKQIRKLSFNFIINQLKDNDAIIPSLKGDDFAVHYPENISNNEKLGIRPFFINIGSYKIPKDLNFSLKAPTTSNNLMRILRAMQIKKPILLEGSPGVGKTSLVTALANASGHRIVRINLSEQTDMMDLLGTDLPVEGGKPGEFGWSDGVFLRALKDGDWVLLDELNLASQSVLEGLNSCLDHRGTVYIPEIGQEFKCPSSFRIFACQNPTQQGGGRKGLPKSFLNRFTQVYIEQFENEDLLYISSAMYPSLPINLLEKMIEFNSRMYNDSMIHGKFGRKGSPWEFNLRDIFRWCSLIMKYSPSKLLEKQNYPLMVEQASRFVNLIYLQRMRTKQDREYICEIFFEIFGINISYTSNPQYKLTSEYLQIGFTQLPVNQKSTLRVKNSHLKILTGQLSILENIMNCIEMNWMTILLGSAGYGKTSIIQLLAKLLGKNLHQFWMNSSVDTTELLGGFEQIDLVRKKKNIISSIEYLIEEITEQIMLYSVQNRIAEFNIIQDIVNEWHVFKTQIKSSSSSLEQNTNFSSQQFKFLISFIDKVKQLEKYCSSKNGSNENINNIILNINNQLTQIQKIDIHSVTGCFEWIDGILLQALENGDWILIDNVNFCNPSVLDRLNPLLETNGSLMVNERGVIDGEVKIIKPHPNFRIFLTMDPENGEISRAMRNRGIEINLLPALKQTKDSDAIILLNEIGIPGSYIPRAMIMFHRSVVRLQLQHSETRLGIRELLRWGSLTISMLQRGYFLEVSLTESMKQVYLRNQRLIRNQESILTFFQEEVINNIFDNDEFHFDSLKSYIKKECSFKAPGLSPSLIPGNYSEKYQTFSSFKNGALAYFLASEQLSQSIDKYVNLLQDTKNASPIEIIKELEKVHAPAVYWSSNLLQAIFTSQSKVLDDKLEFQLCDSPIIQEIQSFDDNNLESKSNFYSILYQTSIQILLESTPINNWYYTTTWIETFLTPLENTIRSYSNNILDSISIVKTVLEHPMIQIIKNHTDELLNTIHEKQLKDPMIDIRSDYPMNECIKWNLSVSSEDIELIWHQIENLANAFSILVRRVMRGQFEQNIYSENNPILSIIQQSYRYCNNTLRKEPTNSLVHLVYNLFINIDSFLLEFLSDIKKHRILNSSEWKIFYTVLFFRDIIWDELHKQNLEVESFIGNWISFCKYWKKFTSLLDINVAPVNTSISLIDNSCKEQNLYWSMSCLLKYGAHQDVLKNEQVSNLYIQITIEIEKLEQFINYLPLSQQMIIKSNIKFQDKMKTIVDALCTLQWLDNNFDESLLKTLSAIPSVIEKELEGYKQKFSKKQDDEDIDEQLSKINSTRDELTWLEYSTTSLIPLKDHMNILLETNQIPKLFSLLFNQLQILRSDSIELSNNNNINEILPELRKLLKNLESGTCSPKDIVSLKHLVWSSEDENELNISLKKLPGLWQELLNQYFKRQWQNSYTKPLSLIQASSNNQNIIPSNELGYLQLFSTIESGSYRQHVGPSQLYQSVQSQLGFHLNSSLSCLPLRYRHEKALQLEQLKDHFKTIFIHIDADNEWYNLFQSFCYILHCECISNSSENNLIELQTYWEQISQIFLNDDLSNFENLISNLENFIDNSINEKEFIDNKKIIKEIFNLFKQYSQLQNSSIDELKSRTKLWVYIGWLQFILLVPNTAIDPTSKYEVKLNTYLKYKNQIETEINTRKYSENIQTGNNTNQIIQQLEITLKDIDSKILKLRNKITHRPEASQYRLLFEDIKQLRDHLVSFSKVDELLGILLQYQGIEREAMWQDRTMEFILTLTKKYPSYTDITLPLTNSIFFMKHGFRLLSSQIAKMKNSNTNFESPELYISYKMQYENIIILLIQLPSIISSKTMKITERIDVLESLLSESALNIIDRFLKQSDSSKCYSKLLQSLHAAVYNLVAIMRGYLPSNLMKILNRLYTIYTLTWQKMKEEERKKKLEDESMYKYKEKSHDEGETDEEEEARHIRELFPDYYDQFQDLDKDENDDNNNNDDDDINFDEQSTSSNIQIETSPILGEDECWFLYEAHQRIFSSNKEQQLLNSGLFSSIDINLLHEYQSKEFLLSYDTANILFSQILDQIPSSIIDKQISSSHVVASFIMKNILTAPPATDLVEKPKSPTQYFENIQIYNIHNDPNIAEAQLLQQPLLKFQKEIENLLIQWPDHPLLQQLLKIIDRLLNFPVYSPLMKFITGLELLLRKAHEWETYAHSKISVKDNMDEIARLIARWRKIELRSWPDILATRVKTYESKAIKWWFDLYQSVILSMNGVKFVSEEKQNEYISQLLQTLTDFAQSSNMGEFSIRMKLLLSFANQLSYSLDESSGLTKKVYSLLMNLHDYYMQYWNSFIQFVETSKQPIQEEVQNFVKLAKWEKLEYYMLKDVADRSHKKLNGFVRKFEAILRTPIATLFNSTEEIYQLPSIQQLIPKDYLMSQILPVKKYQKKLNRKTTKNESILQISSKQIPKMNDIIPNIPENIHKLLRLSSTNKDIIYQHSRFPQLSKKLDKIIISSFDKKIDNQIEVFSLLDQIASGLIDTTQTFKNPEKSRNQKQLAVISYIRLFRSMGILFHTKVRHPSQNDIGSLLQLPPLQLNNLFKYSIQLSSVSFNDNELDSYWSSSAQYYYKNLNRIKKLRELSTNPPIRDLSNREISVTSGYIEHLFALGLEQREFLLNMNSQIHTFLSYSSLFDKIESPFIESSKELNNSPFPQQIYAKSLLYSQSSILDEMIHSFGKMVLIFESCDDKTNSLKVQEYQSKLLIMKENTSKIISIEQFTGYLLITPKNYITLQNQWNVLQSILDDISIILKGKDNSNCIESISKTIISLRNQVHENIVMTPVSSERSILSTRFENQLDNFFNNLDFSIKHILLSIQRILPNIESLDKLIPNVKENITEEEIEDKDNEDNLPSYNDETMNIIEIQKILFSCFDELKINILNQKLENLTKGMESLCNECDRENQMDINILQYCQGFLYQLGIFLEQFDSIMKKLLVHYITWHRGTMKLIYVTSGILSTLLHQGYCKPPEEGEESGDTEDGTGTGLGTGEGQKDVSDQIDDEEQLHKPEEDESKEPVEEQDNGVETAQDFDSELGDVKPQEKDETNESDEEDDEGDEMDKEMGDVDRDEEEILDEQLWNEDEEDENLDEKEGEGSKVDSDQVQDELMANESESKEDGESEEQPKDKNDDKQEPELSDNEEELDGEQSGEDSDNMDGDMVDIQDDEDRNKFDELKEEQDFELPEEMNLDGDDLDEGESDKEDDMEIDPEKDEENGEDMDGDDGDEKETDDLDDNAEEDENEQANPEDGKVQDEEDDETKDEDETLTEETLTKDSYQNEYDEETMEEQIGVRDLTGQDSNIDTNEQPESTEDDESKETEETLSNATQQSSDSQGGWTENRNQQTESDNEKPQQENPQFDPNPYRSLGDASKEWQEKVKMIQDEPPSSMEEQQEQTPSSEESKKADEYQFMNDKDPGADDDDTEQALGPATEEQSQQTSLKKEEEEEDDKDKIEEKEEIDIEDKQNDDVILDSEEPEDIPQENQKDIPKITSRTLQGKKEEIENEDEEMEENGDEDKDKEEIKDEDATEADPTKHDQPIIDRSKLDENENELDNDDIIIQNQLSQTELMELRSQLDEKLTQWRENLDEIEVAQQLWNKYDELTQVASQELCEQLRLILEPTLATKLRGDYRSGKRINMKKVIPYIASHFRKDKIWLRRTKPNKRHYQVMIAIDDSESMSLNHSGPLACEAMTMIAKALSQLEVGELSILKFGETIQLVHPFDQPFSDSIGPQIISQFKFDQKGTNVQQLLDSIIHLLGQARLQSNSQTEHVQLVFIISDGRLSNKSGLGKWIREAEQKRMLIVFIIIDSPNSKDSILQLETVSFAKKQIVRTLYMDDFPFPYYAILHDMNNLPDVLADTLRQWFELSQFS